MNKMGFGYLRLPKTADEKIDCALLEKMADEFVARGGRYFDTAYTYLEGESERALRETVVKRFARESVLIADKLPTWKLKEPEDCEKYFAEMLERCGVDYFDVLLVHGIDADNYVTAEKCGAFEFNERMKAEGKARKTGFSFHDTPELLERILCEHPQVDIVQLQINYLDWESPSLKSRELYEIAMRHGKEIVIMEPVKGGTLAALPEKAAAELPGGDVSPAGWALRFAQGLEGVSVVLSGMSDLKQVLENMQDVPQLAPDERAALEKAAQAIRADTAVGCTGCGYCEAGCPKNIAIPQYFALYNEYCRNPKDDWKIKPAYQAVSAKRGGAGECIGCRKCEKMCPQKIAIVENLKKTAEALA